ncbi:MAG TPA: hypothetical protein VLS46_06530, partial [Gaiellaceae bacterium]|nr:hypothetical protein [Gaiellaceae bacterium]
DARAELVAAAMTESGAHVKVLDAVTGATVASFFPFGTAPTSALEVAVADVDGSGGRDVVAAATTPEGTRVVAVSLDGRTIASFYALEPGLAPGASLAAGDVDGDGIAEIVLGTGPTTTPAAPATGPEQIVAVFDRSGRVRGRFAAFPGRFQGPVRVASGDVTGSSRPEIVTAPGPGTAAEIGVYTDAFLGERDRHHRIARFLAFEPSFLGGATVAVGDVDGDRTGEIIVGSGPGRVGEVLVLDVRGDKHFAVFPFGDAYDGGVSVAAGDLDADGKAEIVASTLEAPPRIRVYGGGGDRRYLLLPAGLETPVEVAVADLDGDGRGEIVAGAAEGAAPRVDVFDGTTGAHRLGIVAYDAAFTGGVHVAAADLDSDGRDEVAVGPGNGGDGRLLILDRRLRRVRSWSPWPWGSWPGVHVAITQRYGLPLVAVPRTSQVRRGVVRPFVVASFRDVAAARATFRAGIRWGDGRTSATAVRPRGAGRYDVVASRRFARPGRYAATVTLTGAGARRAIARSTVIVR